MQNNEDFELLTNAAISSHVIRQHYYKIALTLLTSRSIITLSSRAGLKASSANTHPF